ncbi:armadillo-type protein [Russula dissimulans]|nr:armadillo-type protein [Russula dissimulans]
MHTILDLVTGASPYVPPHLREKSSDSDGVERNVKVTRQLKGLLNKMSEQNLATILDSIEALYREHNRHDVTSSITTFVIESISAHAALLDSYVVLHAALISSLHRIIGVEFAAFFMQNVVSSYERHYDSLSSATTNEAATGPIGKECTNLMVLLSELYNFQVVSCILIYDIIRSLLSAELTEFVVELLLKLLRNSGQQLRQDDPSALKDIIQIVQSKMSGLDTPATSRTRFMLETLTNLKNNKIKRATAQQVRGHTAERLKKLLAGLGKMRHLAPHDPLRVSLGDLHAAETRGKWWLVGAAWRGDPLVEREENSMRTSTGQHGDANALLKLAKKQGMNTDVRRSIFVVLMSSDDYVDACERLAQLNLTEVQQREVVRVIVTCCGNEKAFNPYYAFVCQHLCRTSHSYKITLQFCLWDFLRDLGETSVGGAEVLKNKKGNEDGFELKDVSSAKMRNVANAYAWWVAKGCVALSIFKPVDFTVLKPRTRDFLFHLFHQLFTYTQMSTPIPSDDLPSMRSKGPLEEVFIKATRIQALAMGLVYFLTEIKKASKEEFIQWASAIAIDTLRMGLDVIPTL